MQFTGRACDTFGKYHLLSIAVGTAVLCSSVVASLAASLAASLTDHLDIGRLLRAQAIFLTSQSEFDILLEQP